MKKINNLENLQDVKNNALLSNKIDFVVLVGVTDANPNGDPNYSNRPRTDYDGYGLITAECIKRKIRNRMRDLGAELFYDGEDRIPTLTKLEPYKKVASSDELAKDVCDRYADVRAFGATLTMGSSFAIKNLGIKGAVSVCLARSVDPVDVQSMGITCSVNREKVEGLDSNRMGEKHMVPFGLYKIKGSISAQLAEKSGFTVDDAQMLKQCLRTLFLNDSSSARPAGSMEVLKVYWWEHDSKLGMTSAAVHRSVHVKLKDGLEKPISADSYEISREEIPGLACEELPGL